MDLREQQCIAMNNRTHKWTAAYNVYTKYQCHLACMDVNSKKVAWLNDKVGNICWHQMRKCSFFLFCNWQVIDGTSCSQNTFDKCINGICRPAGCDNKLNSKLKLNNCGICYANDNMCKFHSQTYSAEKIIELNQFRRYLKYFNVTTIPKEAVNVEITRFGHYDDGNYLCKMQILHLIESFK